MSRAVFCKVILCCERRVDRRSSRPCCSPVRRSLPVPGRDLAGELEQNGFRPARQRGTYIIPRREGGPPPMVWDPNRSELKRETAASLARRGALRRKDLEEPGEPVPGLPVCRKALAL